MTPLLQQFISESRDFLQDIGESLMALEKNQNDAELIGELFRLVHTLKGNSGLFQYPEMTEVLHAAEDLMDLVREGSVVFDSDIADCLLESMDFVDRLLDDISEEAYDGARYQVGRDELTARLRKLSTASSDNLELTEHPHAQSQAAVIDLSQIPEQLRIKIYEVSSGALVCVRYCPESDCFFKGEDPFHFIRQLPGLLWGCCKLPDQLQAFKELDYYQSFLSYEGISSAEAEAVVQYFRYVPQQVQIESFNAADLIQPIGEIHNSANLKAFKSQSLELLNSDDFDKIKLNSEAFLSQQKPNAYEASLARWLIVALSQDAKDPNSLAKLKACLEEGVTVEGLREGQNRVNQDTDKNGSTQRIIAGELIERVLGGDGDLDSNSQNNGHSEGSAQSNSQPDVEETKGTNLVDDILLQILDSQLAILSIEDDSAWAQGRLLAVCTTLTTSLKYFPTQQAEIEVFSQKLQQGENADQLRPQLADCLAACIEKLTAEPELDELKSPATPASEEQAGDQVSKGDTEEKPEISEANLASSAAKLDSVSPSGIAAPAGVQNAEAQKKSEDGNKGGQLLKVDQLKIDRLVNLIGELVVAKNSLPYLANKADEDVSGRELAKDIKSQYLVINRITEEMQDVIMQVRMMPVSFVFQRFPRLVRDLARKLGKEVDLILEGEETEADKNIIESISDPMIHLVRNSLDHGLETPEQRKKSGKKPQGSLFISASQDSDRVIIQIRDDGKGIDPKVIKTKAYEKRLINEEQLERLSDQEALQLIFAAGFSTAEQVTDLSGRGVGMDVVRTAIEQVGGEVRLDSEVGHGTTIRLELPLSMTVTNVMVVDTDDRIFGIPMNLIIETVRLPSTEIKEIKSKMTAVLRGRIIPIVTLNSILAIDKAPVKNEDDEFAIIVVRVNGEALGVVVDDFHEVIDVILKPMPGELSKLSIYSGSALLGNGSVLLVINPKEFF